MNWYLAVLKKYAVFSGRACRAEYWMFALFNAIIMLALTFIEMLFRGPGALANLYSLAVLLPSIAVGVRRLHDINRSGWWLLISLIPLVGLIVVIVFSVQDSYPGENAYGPNPKIAA